MIGGTKMLLVVVVLLMVSAVGFVVYDWQRTKAYAADLERQLKLKQKVKTEQIEFHKELDAKFERIRIAQKELDKLREEFMK